MMSKYTDPMALIAKTHPDKPSVVFGHPGDGMTNAFLRAINYFAPKNGQLLVASSMSDFDIDRFFRDDVSSYYYLVIDDFDQCAASVKNKITNYIKQSVRPMRIILTVRQPQTFDFETENYEWHADTVAPYEYGVTKM